jgi:hypothetical protein
MWDMSFLSSAKKYNSTNVLWYLYNCEQRNMYPQWIKQCYVSSFHDAKIQTILNAYFMRKLHILLFPSSEFRKWQALAASSA